jgi:hypothetical protein
MLYDYTYSSSVGVTGVLLYHKHGLNNVNVIDVHEGRIIYVYKKNIKETLFNTSQATCFNKCADSNTYRLNRSIFKLSDNT